MDRPRAALNIVKTFVAVILLALVSTITIAVASASPSAQTGERSASFELLNAVLRDANDKGVLLDNLNDLLTDLFIEYLVTPQTGETVEQARGRLSVEGQSTFQLLTAALTDANDKGVISDDINELLAELFIEYLITPHTGETVEQVRKRLSARPIQNARSLIAFASDRDGNSDIYVMEPDGANVRQLTNADGWYYFPAWSPDGERIAYASDWDGDWDIYIMESDGSNTRRLTDFDQYDVYPDWSPDGEWLTFESNRHRNWDVYVARVDGSEIIRLTDDPAKDYGPDWSPDGQQIAFASERDGDWDIYTMRSDGADVRQLTNDGRTDANPSWSPDGNWIVFQSYRDWWNDDIFVVRADGSDLKQLIDWPSRDAFPEWSPDGEWIAFHSYQDGDFDIYLVRPDGSDVRQLTDVVGGDAFPAWSSQTTAGVQGSPPEPLPADTAYYTQFINARGVTIKASDRVDPAATQHAADIVTMMLDGRQDVRNCMVTSDSEIAIVPDGDPVSALPEYASLRGTRDHWGQFRDSTWSPGLGGNPSATPEQRLIGDPGYPPYRDVHEPAHHLERCFTKRDRQRWADIYRRAVDRVHSVFGPDDPPFDLGLMINASEFFAGLTQYYFYQNDPPRRYAERFFPEAFEFLEEFYGPLTPQESDRPGYTQYVTASSELPLPWLVPGGLTYEHSAFGYTIELLTGWIVEREGVDEVLLSSRNWPWPEIRIEYIHLPRSADADDELARLAASRIEEWNQYTQGWDRSDAESFERVSDGQKSYWIYYYGHESLKYCDIDRVERVLIASYNGRSYGVVLHGGSCHVGNDLVVGDFETMLGSFSP